MRLDDGLLGGETHGEKALGALRFGKLRAFRRHEQAVDEMLAVLARRRFLTRAASSTSTPMPKIIARAPSISAFMSRTAASRPVKIARAMMQWPMLSSTISGIAATGCTLW